MRCAVENVHPLYTEESETTLLSSSGTCSLILSASRIEGIGYANAYFPRTIVSIFCQCYMIPKYGPLLLLHLKDVVGIEIDIQVSIHEGLDQTHGNIIPWPAALEVIP